MAHQEQIAENARASIATFMKPIREEAAGLSKDLREKRTTLNEQIKEQEAPAYGKITEADKARLALMRKQKREAGQTFDALLQTLYERAGVSTQAS